MQGNQIDRHRESRHSQEQSDRYSRRGMVWPFLLAAIEFPNHPGMAPSGQEIDHHSNRDQGGAEPEGEPERQIRD